jgi:hypothetical protein
LDIYHNTPRAGARFFQRDESRNPQDLDITPLGAKYYPWLLERVPICRHIFL